MPGQTLLALALLSAQAQAPVTPPATPAQVQADLNAALRGRWVGLLEYRDYSEPATSARRVQLPTWLEISSAGTSLVEHFVYDDGPGKTVDSTETVLFDAGKLTYTEQEPQKPAAVSAVSGFDKLKSGRGELILLGHGQDNNKPAETRTTLTIRRNLLTWLDEVRPTGSEEAFSFRHRYVFTRADVPVVTAK